MSNPIDVIAIIIIIWLFLGCIGTIMLLGFGAFVYRLHASRVNTQLYKPEELNGKQ